MTILKISIVLFLGLLFVINSNFLINLEKFKLFQCSSDETSIPQYRTCPNMQKYQNKKTICNLLNIKCGIDRM